ncbi:hypothetical protein OIDMADRAFT_62197 [Oidiodendron maius Zn]|uniref:Aconitate hydratase, mitochondrial n=1 Tax=Oidiodendron maius (strain Zn) TaxID=913774 RepID=A0A0C3CSZ4_OIDMZ|nr:hypothetical protein OIDMADRAFT_62197 [Oidiodendron maius Zn]
MHKATLAAFKPSRRLGKYVADGKHFPQYSARIPISNLEKDIFLPYAQLQNTLNLVRRKINRPLTLSEKILYSHLCDVESQDISPGKSFLKLRPDRVACHDANATMAMLQFMSAGIDRVALPTTIHCDHLTMAEKGASPDLAAARVKHREVFQFLESVAARYGIGFWKPGSGIIHTVLFENYAFPGGLLVGTDSHTPNAAGMAMLGIGVGGSDAVDCMSGQQWELPCPKVLGVRLIGQLNGWSSSKDIICHLAGMISVTGGKGKIVEFFGPGTKTLSATAMATVGNMSAEVGATSCVFPYSDAINRYLAATNRSTISDASKGNINLLLADEGSEGYYDNVLEIDLDKLEPTINGPYTPDLSHPVSTFARAVRENAWPVNLSASLVGSCTNSSYEDLVKVASLAKQAKDANVALKVPFYISCGSEKVRSTAEKDGILDTLQGVGATILSNSCGACVGQWNRTDVKKGDTNSIISSYNRNFVGRQDGNERTHSFVTSPEIATAFAFSGSLDFNPTTDSLLNGMGRQFQFQAPAGEELPEEFSYPRGSDIYQAPLPITEATSISVNISKQSDRLQLLKPFPAWNENNAKDLVILLKVKGKCTTDHISPAGPWYDYRGHLDNISNNLLTGAENAFLPSHERGMAQRTLTGVIDSTPIIARSYKDAGIPWCIIGYSNYGEGSSREHAALEPRYLGCTVIIAISFARIHETNLKKQGILPLTFADHTAYDRIKADDKVSILDIPGMEEGKQLVMKIRQADGGCWETMLNHSYSREQIPWLMTGSALNHVKSVSK